MKKFAKALVLLLVLTVVVTCLVACGETPCEHTYSDDLTCHNRACTLCGEIQVATTAHNFDNQIIEDDYIFSTATCTQKARYYYSCECGEKGTQTFEYGEALGHSWGEYVSDNNATYTDDGTKTATCTRTDCGATDTVTDVGTKLPSGISFSAFTVVDNTVNGGVMPYAQSTFDFNQEIDVIGNATYDVCIDQYGLNDYASKTVPLVEGVNTFYVFEKVGGVLVNTYTVTIYRHHLYTVTFDTLGGSEVTSQQVEEGALLSTTVIPTKVGYTFASWDYNFDTPITSSMTITANWTANTDTAYKVEYYLQNLENDNYSLSETVNKSGTTDTTASVSAKSIEHFTYNEALSTASGNIAGNGSLVLKLYYTRDSYDITAQVNNSKAGTVSGSGTYKYAKEITLTATTNDGYTFLGWNDGTGIVCEELSYTFEVDRDITLTAEWNANTDTAYTIEYYLQNLENDNYSLSETVGKTGATDTTASVSAKSIEHFTYNEALSNASGNIAGDGSLVLKLYYTRDMYTVTFVGDGGTLTSGNAIQSIKYGGSAIAPTFSKTGYTFTGFDKDYDNITEPITVTAEWSINQYTLTIVYGNGQEDRKIAQDYGTTIPNIDNPTVDIAGYGFTGWDKDIPTTMPAKDITVTAQWSAIFTVSNGTISGLTAYGENNYTELEIPSQINGIEIVGISDRAFENCESLTSVTIPDGVTYIGVDAFRYCTSLSAISIPDSVTDIGEDAFSDTTYYSDVSNWENDVLYVDNHLIKARNSISGAYVIKEGTKTVASFAFFECDTLTGVTIPDSVTSICRWAFDGCDLLESVTIGENSQLTTIGSDAFCGTCFTSITIPSGVKSIGSLAFCGNSSLVNIDVSEDNLYYKDVDGNLFSKDGTTLIQYAQGKANAWYIVPDSVTNIGEYAFYSCGSLTSIIIPDSVTSIGGYAFSDCYSTIYCEVESMPSGWDDYWNYNNLPVVWGYTYVILDDIIYSIEDEVATVAGRTSNITTANIYANVTYEGMSYPVTSIGEYAFSNCTSLESVTFGENSQLESIGCEAFGVCTRLASITIPDSVTNIGASAFWACDSLTSIIIPDSVTSIGDYALSGCPIEKATIPAFAIPYINKYSLEEIVLTSGDSIGSFAFEDCYSLTSITIPDSVKSIGEEAFVGCVSLVKVNYLGTIDQWVEIEFDSNPLSRVGNLHIDDVLVEDVELTTATKISAYAFDNCTSLTSIAIPNSVTSIGEYAFSGCSSLESVTFGENSQLESIGSYAFSNCTSLTSIAIPDSVTSIGNDAFFNCTLLESIIMPDSVTHIGDGAFNLCYIQKATVPAFAIPSIKNSLLKEVVITSGDSIGNYAFDNCASLTSITIPDSVTSIGESAFSGCSSLTSITIPDSVTSIGWGAFGDCTSLNKVNFLGTIDQWVEIEFSNWSSNPLLSANNLYIKDVLVEDVVLTNATKISDYAFEICTSLTSITIPDSVTSIGDYAFSNCDSLESVNFDENSQLESIGYEAFGGCDSLTSITIPDSVTSIGTSAFAGCISLTSIIIPDSVTNIGEHAFWTCDSLTIYCEATSKPSGWESDWNMSDRPVVWGYDLVLDGIIYGIEDEVATVVGRTSSIITANISANVTYEGMSYPVTSIGEYAFSNCTSLESVTFGENSQLESIGDYAFLYCPSLTIITIPDSVTSIGSNAFSNCTSLNKVNYLGTIDQWVEIDFNGSFANPLYCAKNLYINDVLVEDVVLTTATKISSNVFYNCTSLTSITIPDSVTSIDSGVFRNCTSLTNILVDENNASYKSIDGNLYSKDSKTLIQYAMGKTDTSFTIPDSVTSIGEWAFYYCTSLTSITIPDSVTSIGDHAFSSCNSLTSITIPDSVTSIDWWVFNSCTSLTIYCEAESKPSGWDSDWNYSSCPVVWDCNNNDVADDGYIYTVIDGIRYGIKDGVATVVRQPRNITTANIPANVTYKGTTYAVTSIGARAFYNCDSLTSITIPDSVTNIGEYAFWACTSLTSITIPDSVTSIGSYAFDDCDALTIYCEATSEPSGWESDWNYSNCPVVWGYKGE